VIKRFKNAITEAVSKGEIPKGFPSQLVKVARRKLGYLNAAVSLDDLRSLPGNKLHPLTKDREGQHAIWVNDQYRIWKALRRSRSLTTTTDETTSHVNEQALP
jgi:proteic killer suppression protein